MSRILAKWQPVHFSVAINLTAHMSVGASDIMVRDDKVVSMTTLPFWGW